MARMRALVCEAARGADSCLEIAAGTGLVTLDLAAEVQHLIATDYSQTMIEIVGERVRARGLTNVAGMTVCCYELLPGIIPIAFIEAEFAQKFRPLTVFSSS